MIEWRVCESVLKWKLHLVANLVLYSYTDRVSQCQGEGPFLRKPRHQTPKRRQSKTSRLLQHSLSSQTPIFWPDRKAWSIAQIFPVEILFFREGTSKKIWRPTLCRLVWKTPMFCPAINKNYQEKMSKQPTMPDQKVQLAWFHPPGIEVERRWEKLYPQPPPLHGIRHLLEWSVHISAPHKAGHFFGQCFSSFSFSFSTWRGFLRNDSWKLNVLSLLGADFK